MHQHLSFARLFKSQTSVKLTLVSCRAKSWLDVVKQIKMESLANKLRSKNKTRKNFPPRKRLLENYLS